MLIIFLFLMFTIVTCTVSDRRRKEKTRQWIREMDIRNAQLRRAAEIEKNKSNNNKPKTRKKKMAENKVQHFYKGAVNVEHLDKQVIKNYYGRDGGEQLTMDELRHRIESVLPFFKCSSHWFSVCKVLMVTGEISEGDFESAITLINAAFDGKVPYEFNMKSMSELNSLSMRLSPKEWNLQDSPVTKGFSTYHTIALRFLKFFEEE